MITVAAFGVRGPSLALSRARASSVATKRDRKKKFRSIGLGPAGFLFEIDDDNVGPRLGCCVLVIFGMRPLTHFS